MTVISSPCRKESVMMRPEVRDEHIKKYGSFLRCPERGNLCTGINAPDGICRRNPCFLDDPEYIKLQEQIEARRRELDNRRSAKETVEQKRSDPAKELAGYTARRENTARRYYRENRPKQADRIMQEVLMLQARLRTMKKGK